MFTQYLQEAFQAPLVIQLTDDEKALWRQVSQPAQLFRIRTWHLKFAMHLLGMLAAISD